MFSVFCRCWFAAKSYLDKRNKLSLNKETYIQRLLSNVHSQIHGSEVKSKFSTETETGRAYHTFQTGDAHHVLLNHCRQREQEATRWLLRGGQGTGNKNHFQLLLRAPQTWGWLHVLRSFSKTLLVLRNRNREMLVTTNTRNLSSCLHFNITISS